MSQAAKFFDPVLGIDIHMVVLPASPAPVPMPHPFIGIVFDPIGAAIGAAIGFVLGGGGPVLINSLPVGNTGTAVLGIPHFPIGGPFHPCDKPGNEGVIVLGSKTVTMAGASTGRLGSLVMSCNFPINLPTSVCLAVPMGAPVIVGGPDSFDYAAAGFQFLRTKWVSDKLHKPLKAPPGSRRSKFICFLTGHPVDVMTGAVLTDATDFELPGPLPLKFERNYYSRDPQSGALGQGWSHSLEAALDEQVDTLLVQFMDGRRRLHARLAVGESIFEPTERYDLMHTAAGYLLRYVGGPTLEFVRCPGAARSHPLARVHDGNGRTIELSYSAGSLTAGIDSAGRRLRFLRDSTGRLTAVQLLRGDRWTELVSYRFDFEGRLASAIDPGGHARIYAYRGGVLVRETDRNGVSYHFEYDWDDPDGWCVHTWGDNGQYERRLTYDKHRHVTIVDDGRGGRTHYFGNSAGLVDRLLDPMGAEWKFAWDPALLRISEQIDPLGNRRTWTYDARGNTLAVTDELARTTRWKYDRYDRPIEMLDAAGHPWKRKYDERGNLVAEVDPLGATCSYTYDARGDLVRAVDTRGNVAGLMYDAAHQMIAATDREGHVRRFAYDDRGLLVRQTGPLGEETVAHWDKRGSLISVVRPDGARDSFEYDAEGNPTRHVDGLGNVRRYIWTGRGKLAARVDPLGETIRYIYDCEDNLVELYNQAGEKFRFEYDLCNRPRRTIGFDGVTTSFTYDPAGRRISITNGRGQTRRLERDAAGQVVAESGPDGLSKRFVYDARGELIEASSASGTIRFILDACARVVREVQGDHWLERTYDRSGSVTERRTSIGADVSWRHDRQGRLVGLSVEAGELELERDALGYEVVRRLPGGIVVETARDRSGRPTEQRMLQPAIDGVTRAVEVHKITYAWRAEDQLAQRTDATGVVRFRHDPRGALIAAELPDGSVDHRATDKVGNIFRTPERQDRVYGPGGRLEQAGDELFAYDSDGNVIRRLTTGGAAWRYEWDSFGLLTAVTRPDGGRVEFTHDALCRRIAVRHLDAGGKLTRTERALWDDDDVYALDDGDGQWTTWCFLPGESTPLACVRNGELLAAVTDHLGAPLLLMSGPDIVWAGSYDIYGTCTERGSVSCPWRWPGQLSDAATGLYYNRFRHFDPGLGRYLSQDPLGPALGEGMYLYPLDVLRWIDPLGLAGWVNLGGGWTGRVDNFPTSKGAGFEIHVYRPSGHEVGVFGPSGFFNKHSHKADSITIPDQIFNRLKGIAVDEMRRLGVLPKQGRANIKGDGWITKQNWDNPNPGAC